MSMPTSCASAPISRSKRASSGASLRQGAHHEAQELTTTGLPLRATRWTGGGTRASPSRAGAGLRTEEGMKLDDWVVPPDRARRRPVANTAAKRSEERRVG